MDALGPKAMGNLCVRLNPKAATTDAKVDKSAAAMTEKVKLSKTEFSTKARHVPFSRAVCSLPNFCVKGFSFDASVGTIGFEHIGQFPRALR